MRKLALSLLLGTVALFCATACGPAAATGGLIASAEAEALAAMGVDPADIVPAEAGLDPASPSARPKKDGERGDGRKLENWNKRHPAKVGLHRNVLHGEAVVQTKEGTITVVVQRGEITAITGDSVTVKSSDGFTLAWKFHENLRVVEKRATIQPSQLKVGANIALAGPKTGDTPMARLIVIPLAN